MIHLIKLMQTHYHALARVMLAMLLARATHYQQLYDELHKAPASQH